MAGLNMAAITASLEKSLQNCSLNPHEESSCSSGDGAGIGHSATWTSPENHHLQDATLELDSQISLPFHWEQCLDLKTGEIYYINWKTGMKVNEDPRSTGGDFYSEDDCSSYDSEESSSEQSPNSSSRVVVVDHDQTQSINDEHGDDDNLNVLVVAGCKRCLMYHMVPKQLQDCPKCCGQLIYFDRSENAASP